MSDTEETKVSTAPDDNNNDVETDNVDAKVYDQNNDLIAETHEAEFVVCNPQNRGGHIVYTCKGADSTGLW